jgi:hypothetical protein
MTQRNGAWIELNWSLAYVINRVRLHDRPNTDDQVLSGTLTFSDGSSVAVGPLANDGTGVDVVVSPRRVRWVRFTADTVSLRTANIGLAEILVFEQSGTTPDQPPIAMAGPDQTVAGGASVQLDGRSSSDPEGASITLAWTQTSGPAVVITNVSPGLASFTAPAQIRAAQVLTFQLTVNDGISSSIDTINVTVPGLPNAVPVANAGPDQNVSGGAAVQLDGRASSDADSDPLTYTWTQTSGPTVTLTGATTAQPTFTAPAAQSAAQQIAFSLVVRDGFVNSAADTVVITIAGQANSANVAPLATVTASSQASVNQGSAKAVDGIVSGYPAMSSAEWATASERVGAWIQLNWSTARTVNRIRLYDRPNLDDQMTGGTLTFSDGSSIVIGALPNNGSVLEVNFTSRTIQWVRLRVDAVSSRTGRVGLAEFEVYTAPQ